MLSVWWKLRTFIENQPLRPTIAATLLLGLALPVIVAASRDLAERRDVLLEMLASDHRRLSEMLAIGMATPVWEVRADTGQPMIEAVMRDPRVVEVSVDAPSLPRFLYAAAPERRDSDVLVQEQPIRRGSEEIGRVRVTMSTAPVHAEVMRQGWQVLLTGLLQFAIGLLLLFSLLRVKVLSPVERLVRASRALAGGDLEPHARWMRSDELGVLGRSFEETRRSLRRLIGDLETTNRDLRQREADLSRQTTLLRATLDNMTDGITLVDSRLHLQAWNDRFRQILDFPAEVVRAGMPINELHVYDVTRGAYAESTAGDFLLRMQAGFIPGRSWSTQVERSDGRTVSIRRQPLAEGGFVTTYTDVTEQMAAQRAASEALHLLEAVMDAVPAVLHLKDRDLRYRLVNNYFLTLWGFRREDVIGRTAGEVFDPAFLAEFVDRAADVVESGRALPFYEWSALLPDGDRIELLGTKVPLTDANGRVTHVVTVEIDISQRKRAERALRESEELHRLLVDLTPLGIMLHDRARIRFLNPAGCRILDVPDPEPVLGMHLIDFVADDEKAVAFERFGRLFQLDEPLGQEERRLNTIDGVPIEVSIAAVPVRRAEETLALVVFQDISQRKRAEKAIRESERFYRRLVDAAPYGILLHDALGIVLLNPAGQRILGVSDVGQVIGHHYRELVHPDERNAAVSRLDQVLGGSITGAAERRLIGLDGREVDVTIAGVPLGRDDERLAFVMFLDVTERKRAEAGRQRWLQLFQDAIASIPNGFAMFDAERRLVTCNTAFAELYATTPDGLAGSSAAAILERFARLTASVDGQPVNQIATDIGRLLDRLWWDTSGPAQVELLDGRWMLLAHHRTGEGGLVIVRTDITDLKRMQEALADSEELYRLLVDLSPYGILLHDRNSVVFMNPAGCAMLGAADADAVVGRHYSEFVVDDERSAAQQRIVRVLEGGEVLEEAERRLMTLDGREITVATSAVPFSRAGSRLAYVFFTDISGRKRAEAEIARQRDALHQAEKMSALGSLLAGVAHELNNPLAVVVGRAIMLEDRPLDPSITVGIGKIRIAAERCARIVKSFLAMARQQAPERTPVAVCLMIDAALDLLGYDLESAGIEVVYDVPPDLPQVMADADQLTQVFNNLIINAKQAMTDAPEPRILRIRAHLEDPAGSLCVSVADSGPGIPPAIRARIFDPFFTTKPAGVGTGIGLAVCRGIVEAHGGSIELADEPGGGGAVFIVRLPAVLPEAAPPRSPSRSSPPPPPAAPAASSPEPPGAPPSPRPRPRRKGGRGAAGG